MATGMQHNSSPGIQVPTPAFPDGTAILRSTRHCPYCFTATEGAASCHHCGLDLTRSELATVHETSLQIADLLDERRDQISTALEHSLAAARAAAAAPVELIAPPQAQDAAATMASTPESPAQPAPALQQQVETEHPLIPAQFPVPQAAAPHAPVATASPRPPSMPPAPLQTAPGPRSTATQPAAPRRRLSPQTLLLITGVSFLAVAAIVFLTFAFVMFDLTTKAVITAGVTLAVLVGASLLRWRKLDATAEGVAVFGVVLLALDIWAMRSLNFFGLGASPALVYWGGALLVLAAICLGWGRASRLRAPVIVAALSVVPGLTLLAAGFTLELNEQPAAFLLAIAGVVAVATLITRFTSRDAELESQLVLGTSQLAAAVVMMHAVSIVAGQGSWLGVVGAIALTGALVWQLATIQRHARYGTTDDHGQTPLQWLRIPAAVLGTLAWFIAAFLSYASLIPHVSTAHSVLLPLAALAVPAWDAVRFGMWRRPAAAGLVTALILAVPTTLLGLGLPFILEILNRTLDEANPALTLNLNAQHLLAFGLSTLFACIVAAILYRIPLGLQTFTAEEPRRDRTQLLGTVAVFALVLIAFALPQRIALAALALIAIAGLVTRMLADSRKLIALGYFADVALGLAIGAALLSVEFATPIAVMVAAAALVLLIVRQFIAAGRPALPVAVAIVLVALIMLAQGLFAHRTNDQFLSPLACGVAALLLLIAIVPGRQQPHETDARVLGVAGTGLAMLVAAAQLIGVAEGRTAFTLAATIAVVVAAITVTIIILVTTRQTRMPSILRSIALTALPWFVALALMGALAAAPWLTLGGTQLGGAALVLSASAMLSAALIAALPTVPDGEKTGAVAGTLFQVAAAIAVFVTVLSRADVATIDAATTGMLAASFLLLGRTIGRGSALGAPITWFAPATAGLLGSWLMQQLSASDDPLLTFSPLIGALAASALVVALRPAARTSPGSWLFAGLATGAFALLFTTALLRPVLDASPIVSAFVVAVSAVLVAALVFLRLPEWFVPTRSVLGTVSAVFLPIATARFVALVDWPLLIEVALAVIVLAVTIALATRIPNAVDHLRADEVAVPLPSIITGVVLASAVISFVVLTTDVASFALIAAYLVLGIAVGRLASSAPHPSGLLLNIATGVLALCAAVPAIATATPIDLMGWTTISALALAAIAVGVDLWRTAVASSVRRVAGVVIPIVVWSALALLPVPLSAPWWPLTVATTIALVLAIWLVLRRAAESATLAGATLSASVLPIIALVAGASGGVEPSELGLLTSSTAVAVAGAGTIALFGAPSSWPALVVRLSRAALTLLAGIGSVALTQQLGRSEAALAAIPTAVLAIGVAVALIADSRRRPELAVDAPIYAALAPVWFVGTLLLSADEPATTPWMLGSALGFAALALTLAALRNRTRNLVALTLTVALLTCAAVSIVALVGLLVGDRGFLDEVGVVDLVVAAPVSVLLLLTQAIIQFVWAAPPANSFDGAAPRWSEAIARATPMAIAIIAIVNGHLVGLHTIAVNDGATVDAALASRMLVGQALMAAPLLLALVPLRGWRAGPAWLRNTTVLFGVTLAVFVAITAMSAAANGITPPVELFTLPGGLTFSALGFVYLRRIPALRSWPALAPGLVVTLIPSLIAELVEPTAWRIAVVTVLTVAAILLGAVGKLQAPLVLGTIVGVVHAIIAIRTTLPELVVPWWVWLAIAGSILVTVAATYEARMRDARRLAQTIRSLR